MIDEGNIEIVITIAFSYVISLLDFHSSVNGGNVREAMKYIINRVTNVQRGVGGSYQY